jgi:hypothetical protein
VPPADPYPSTVQREALLKFVDALNCWDRALRRDDLGDWHVRGKLGHIYAVPGMATHPGIAPGEGFQIYFRGAEEFEEPPAGSQAWAFAKQAMSSFAETAIDGDREGIMFMRRLPTPAEAAIIRDKLGIRKRTEFDEETLARKREQMLMARASGVARTASDTDPAPGGPETPAGGSDADLSPTTASGSE